jgi:hypothetical protein
MLPGIAPEQWQLFERAVDQILSWRPARSKKQTRTAQRPGKSTTVKAKSNPLKPLRKRSGRLMTAPSKPLRSPRKQGGKSMPVKVRSKRARLQRKHRGKLR